MVNTIVWRAFACLCIAIVTVTNSLAQHNLFFSFNIGKYFTTFFPGFAEADKYDPFKTQPIYHDDFDIRFYAPTHHPRYTKRINIGYYINDNNYVDFAYLWFGILGAIKCKYSFQYMTQTLSVGYNTEYRIRNRNFLIFVSTINLSHQMGRIKGDSSVVASFLPMDCYSYSSPPKIRISAIGIGYSPAIHIKIWKSFFTTINAQATLYLFGKNAGFQPLQINLMLGLAWKPQINTKNKK